MHWHDQLFLAPLTRGGNLPFRRLCVELGATVTVSEMAYARQVRRGSSPELALLRRHPSETWFGVQLAASNPDDAVAAAGLAVERGAAFVDLNAGCPIHDVVRRGMGTTLLRRTRALARLVEAMVAALPVPVTVKIRLGWSEGEQNAGEVAHAVEEAGAAALAVHGRTREQRYSKAADWDAIARLVAERSIPIIGNGDILTHYEAAWRQQQSGCASLMIGRGALIKPWLFSELRDRRELDPGPTERIGILMRLVGFMKEHFGDDQRGRKKAMFFLPWHLGFFCRYRPLPAAEFAESARDHPLLQTRLPTPSTGDALVLLLADPRPAVHDEIASALWDATDAGDAVDRLSQLAAATPPDSSQDAASEIAASHG